MTSNANDAATGGQRGRILVVDDEIPLAIAFRNLLTSAGYTVDMVHDGSDAIGLVDNGKYDTIVSDISMPNMTGVELLRQVRLRDVDVPVILVTGTPAIETAVRAIEYGVFRYLVKPIDLTNLRQAVTDASWVRRLAILKREMLAHLGTDERMLGDRASTEVRFDRALSQLWIAFQPIVDWRAKKVYGYEALVRANDTQFGNPHALFSAAEQLGRVAELGRIIRDRVAASMKDAPDGFIFVNLHALDLQDATLFEASSPLSQHAKRVVLEITERSSLDQIRDVTTRMNTLRSLGFRLALDDMGAGHAGLTSFARLVPEIIKLDMSLIRGVHKDPVKRKLIGAMTAVCHELKLLVVAEGVEEPGERDLIDELGCDLMQGYLFARPAGGFPKVTW